MNDKCYFATLFDSKYISRGLVQYISLQLRLPNSHLYILCLDRDCYRTMNGLFLSNVHLVSLEELEAYDADLLRVKSDRSWAEYIFTLFASWGLYVCDKIGHGESFFYIDSDCKFYSSPQSLFDEMKTMAVGLFKHDFAACSSACLAYGYFNAGAFGIRKTAEAYAALSWWRERSLEWCYDRVEGDKFANQGYLTEMAKLFSGVATIAHAGANVAPWNVENRLFDIRGGNVYVNNVPLIFYHYHGLKYLGFGIYSLGLSPYAGGMSKNVKQAIYGTYIKEVYALARKYSLDSSRNMFSTRVTSGLRGLLKIILSGDFYTLWR